DTLPGPVPDCGARVTGPQAPVDPGRTGELVLTEGVLEWEWTVALHYLADQDGQVTVAMPQGEAVQVPGREGLHTAYVRLVGGGQALRGAADSPGLTPCLASGELDTVSAEKGATRPPRLAGASPRAWPGCARCPLSRCSTPAPRSGPAATPRTPPATSPPGWRSRSRSSAPCRRACCSGRGRRCCAATGTHRWAGPRRWAATCIDVPA